MPLPGSRSRPMLIEARPVGTPGSSKDPSAPVRTTESPPATSALGTGVPSANCTCPRTVARLCRLMLTTLPTFGTAGTSHRFPVRVLSAEMAITSQVPSGTVAMKRPLESASTNATTTSKRLPHLVFRWPIAIRAFPCGVSPSASKTEPISIASSPRGSLRTISSSTASPGAVKVPATVRAVPSGASTWIVKLPRGTPKKAKRPSSPTIKPLPNSRLLGSGKRLTAAPRRVVLPSPARIWPVTVPRPRKRRATGSSVPRRGPISSIRSRRTARSIPSAVAIAAGKPAIPKVSKSVPSAPSSWSNSSNRSRANCPSSSDCKIRASASGESPAVSLAARVKGTPARMKSR